MPKLFSETPKHNFIIPSNAIFFLIRKKLQALQNYLNNFFTQLNHIHSSNMKHFICILVILKLVGCIPVEKWHKSDDGSLFYIETEAKVSPKKFNKDFLKIKKTVHPLVQLVSSLE